MRRFLEKYMTTVPKHIFVTGGVTSSLGKGILAASLAKLLQLRGYRVTIQKFDPYINIDPGTLNPYEHGECYVTDDGAETDLDLGHYERFTGVPARNTASVSSGRIYSTVLEKARRGDYLGKTIQVVPHVTNEIKDFISIGEDEVDFMLCEIGGTVGESYVLTAAKDIAPRAGLSTLDLLILRRHMLGIETFDSPFLRVAADLNRDGEVDVLDLVALRGLILGRPEFYPDGSPWRFVDADWDGTGDPEEAI